MDNNWFNEPPGGPVAVEPIHTPEDDIVVNGTDGTVRTLVDGEEAVVDTRTPDPEPMVPQDTLETLVHGLRTVDGWIAEVETRKKEVADHLKRLEGERESIIARMKALDESGAQLPLVAQQDAEE